MIDDWESRLDDLSELKENWNTYGAPPIDPRSILSARKLFRSICVIPTTRGGIQIDSHVAGHDIEIELDETGSICVFSLEKSDA